MDKNEEQWSLLIKDEPIDDKILTMSDEIGAVMNKMLDEYITDEEYDDNLNNILDDDEYLTEELIDKIAFLNFVESAPEGEFSKEEIEHIYLSVIDSFFELSKLISPLNGFGKDRLEAGLSLIKQFEERYWPVATRIVPENVGAFSELIPIEHYEDIIAGRKRAIGALRHVGDDVYAAGAICYSVYDEPDEDFVVNVDFIMVHDDLREQGVGNFLMAQLIEAANGAVITVELPARQTEDELRELDIMENFFDSWKFGFSMGYSSGFVIKLSDVGESEVIKRGKAGNVKEVKSLDELGDNGAYMLRLFFKKRNQSYDADIAALPYNYFDPDVSCVALSGKDICSILLFHRFEDGDYRYEAFKCIDEKHVIDLPKLILYAYDKASDKEDGDHMITGFFISEKGYDAAGKLLPNARIPMVYKGAMYPPEDIITSEEWGELRLKAGFSNDKIPEDDFSDEDIGENDEELMREFIANNEFKL